MKEIESLKEQFSHDKENSSLANNIGILLLNHTEIKDALHYLQHATHLAPQNPNYFTNLGIAHSLNNETNKAKIAFLHAYSLDPLNADVCNNLANCYLTEGQLEKACQLFLEAINHNPNLARAYNNLASVYIKQKKFTEAYNLLQQAITLAPHDLLIMTNWGKILKHFSNIKEAKEIFEQILHIDPNHIEALINLGDALRMKGDESPKTRNYFERVLALDPNHSDANYFMGLIYYNAQQSDKAISFFQRSISSKQPSLYALGFINQCQLACGNWDESEKAIKQANELINSNQHFEPITPFIAQAIFKDQSLYLKACKLWSDYYASRLLNPPFPRIPYQHKKLRIGYISPDFTHHPIGLLLNDLLKLHDREKFDIYGFPTKSAKSEIFYKICKSCDHIHELYDLSKDDAAQIIRDYEIDILIDLTGATDFDNYEILVRQPAPIQCHLLGVTGTTGTHFIQYIFTTELVAPPEFVSYYTEKLVYLPDAEIARRGFNIVSFPVHRSDYDLPEDAFVFLAYHVHYRIDKPSLLTWFEILNNVPNSVLWFRCTQEQLKNNVLQLAASCGIAAHRICFKTDDNLTTKWSHRLADLFLDTFNFTSGTCIFISLWAGTPFLTCLGPAPHNRIGASYCQANGSPELIAHSREEYIQKAIEWGNNPDKLKAIKNKLLAQRENSKLFDPNSYIKNLEKGLELIWQDFITQSSEKILKIT